MAQKHRSRPDEGRLACDRLPGTSHSISNLPSHQVQFLIVAHHVRPELATMMAVLVFGGGNCHG